MDLVSGERDSRFARFLRFADESQFPSTSAKRDGDERSTLNLQSGEIPGAIHCSDEDEFVKMFEDDEKHCAMQRCW